MLVSFTC